MLKLPLYFISDNHFHIDINEFEDSRRKKLFHIFDKIKLTGGTLIIGGDFFDFWFDYKYVIPSGYINLLTELSKLQKSGVIIHYVLGNHDYWDFGSLKNQFNAHVHKENFEFKFNSSPILVTHGDGLLKNDYGYRLMKKIIRSKLCIFLFKNFHPDYGYTLAKFISNTSAEYHHHDIESNAIKDELIQYARLQWNLGIKTVLIGHYHQTGIIKENENRLIFMGDWLKHFTVTRFDENGWWQGNWENV